MKRAKRFSRRAMLRGAGGIAIALPFLDLMRPARALAQSSKPKRVILMTSPNGVLTDQWFPDTSKLGTSDFTLSPILEGLERHKQDLNVLFGVDNRITGGGHGAGMCSLFTGAKPLHNGKSHQGGALSLDQYAAQKWAQSEHTRTPFSSLVLGTNSDYQASTSSVSFAAAKTPVPKVHGAKNMFDYLFVSGDGEQGDRLRKVRGSILDSVRGELTHITPQLGYEDRERMDLHLSSIRELELRLSSISMCGIGDFEPGTANNDATALDEMLPQMFEVLKLAFACDLTRSVSLVNRLEGHASKWTFGWLGIGPGGNAFEADTTDNEHSTSHHSLSHHDQYDHNRVHLTKINHWYMEQLALLIDALKATPEGGREGESVFDNTVIVHASPMARGNHAGNDMPFLLAGSAGGALKTGQYLNLRPGQETSFFGKALHESSSKIHEWGRGQDPGDSHYLGRSHNDVLLSVLRALDFEDETFGDEEHNDGVIEELLA